MERCQMIATQPYSMNNQSQIMTNLMQIVILMTNAHICRALIYIIMAVVY